MNHIRRTPRRAAIVAVAVTTAALGACRDAAVELGPTLPAARTNADLLFGSLAARWENVHRHPKFERGRIRIGRHALSPSGVLNDTAVWTASPDSITRLLYLRGAPGIDGYSFSPSPIPPTVDEPGESRHAFRLRRLGGSDYEWITTVDQALGTADPADVASAFTRFLAGAEGHSEPSAREEYRSSLPRATLALGALLTLDTLRPARLSDGSTLISARARIHPDRIRGRMPNFARYIDKYIEPARFRITFHDVQGEWAVFAGDDNVLTARLRTRDGALQPLTGPARALPDSLQLRMDFAAKFFIFTVGFSDLAGDMSFVRRDDERGWTFRFRREPRWHLPLAASRFLRAPLRRPFEGEGAALEISVRRSPEGQLLLHRRAQIIVRESAILRWLGGLGFSAMSEFTQRAEAEENRFNVEVLQALRADLVELLAP